MSTATLTGLVFATVHGLLDLQAGGRMKEAKGLSKASEGVAALLKLIRHVALKIKGELPMKMQDLQRFAAAERMIPNAPVQASRTIAIDAPIEQVWSFRRMSPLGQTGTLISQSQ